MQAAEQSGSFERLADSGPLLPRESAMKMIGGSSALFACMFALAGTVHAQVLISQVYGGGNSGASMKSDFI